MIETIPHTKNFCGGNFQDWLDVMLTPKCNGKCSFCIEKTGFKPTESVNWAVLGDAIIKANKTNILLLGGEPTLYPALPELIIFLKQMKKNITITTNGGKLMNEDFLRYLQGVSAVNISIHHYELSTNREITGIPLTTYGLQTAVNKLHSMGAKVRINCNCISGYIDSEVQIHRFIRIE